MSRPLNLRERIRITSPARGELLIQHERDRRPEERPVPAQRHACALMSPTPPTVSSSKSWAAMEDRGTPRVLAWRT